VKLIDNDPILKLELPIPELLSKAITVLLDSKGEILEAFCPEQFTFSSAFAQIKILKNIRQIFKTGDAETVTDALDSTRELYAYFPDVRLDEVIEPIYTTHPVLVMKLHPAGKDRFLGVVNTSGIMPTHFEHSSGSLLYIDDQDRLVGFYHSFFEHFGRGYDKPEKMLLQTADRFFSPTPLEMQRNYLKMAVPFSDGPYPVLYNRTFSGDTEGGEEACPPDAMKKTGAACEWSAGSPRGATVTVKAPVDFGKCDVRVSFEFKLVKGQGPMVIFGDLGETPSGFLDDNGYSIGPHPYMNKIVIKRRGMNIAVVPFESAAPGIQKWTMEKVGRGFAVSFQGKPLFHHFDADFLARDSYHVSLYLRNGSSCVLNRLTVETKKNEPVLANNSIVVRGNNQKYYLLNSFYSNYLTSIARPLYGFRLQDITDFQNRVRDLEARHEKHLRVETELRTMLEAVQKEKSVFVGASREIAIIKEKAKRIAASPTTILLQGATGTGKEVLARFIHDNSHHAQGPFVKIDCSTLPKTLMESELFGHEAGAFTGAQKRKSGLLEQANKGTLFLDELNNLTMDTQVKLLQFLQDQTITRVGGSAPVKVNTRVIAASNQDLEQMVKQGLFREDLYYRIAVVTFSIPPLRLRMDDLAELAHHFLEQFGRSYHKNIHGFSPAAMKKMFSYEWPGNIRELRNAVEQAVLFCDSDQIQPEHIAVRPEGRTQARMDTASGADSEDKRCKIMLTAEETKELLNRYHGQIIKAARAVNVTRRALYYYMKKLGLNPNDFRKKPHNRKRRE
jgi:DNA-binding NtrC family response regulator